MAAASLVSAHPHLARDDPEFAKRATFQQKARRSLGGCQAELMRRGGVYERGIARRAALAEKAREDKLLRRDMPYRKRDFASILATDHHSNLTGVTNSTDASILFTGNGSCVLGPETTQGPYYVDGEYVRWDIREDQEGVDTYVDVQLIDVNTCDPVEGVYIDFWHANATGVYSGIVASGNGDSSDESNLNKTWLRGLQATNEDGVAQWLTVFPGHYTSRATHVHILAHQNGTFFENGTFTSDEVSHVGQIFFDQSLISEVELTAPYNTNTQELTTNSDDQIMSEEAADIDPVVEYVYLGDDVTDGLMAWVALGIDTTAYSTVSPAATLTENGGVENASSGGMGGGGGDMPSGSMGAPPSASASASASA
ncbi:aromatic compound dioxygenase [Cylindrobasidium torrendii FP15055 ss-10]|uniref:Aromatic compound dioxygenase n=1 Tax=Cylindrobasidium torrendii FP15055 ss-10 TaxID=1314674 RepID=A0A0D7B7C0_9AGAR|nr:aromatic compound dioxygenase [Cylindrobasidium torrendii FP15055 ss-10]